MTILYKFDAQGGFICGDTETKLTSYAYPTSPYANESRREPLKIAKAMLKSENWRKPVHFVPASIIREYDVRNWDRLAVAP